MSVKTIVATGLFVLALLSPLGGVGKSAALPIPTVFHGEFTSLICQNAGSTHFLLQINFDPGTGITLQQADTLFQDFLTGSGNESVLLALVGGLSNPSCTFSPTFINQNTTLDAFDLAQLVSGAYVSAGYSSYFVFDTYFFTAPSFLGSISVLRVDAYFAVGPNDFAYAASIEVPLSGIPF